MKKYFVFFGMISLLLGLSSCQPQVEDNPSYDPISNTVNTQFVLNIAPAERNPSTKQLSTNVQMGHEFRGIDEATMFAFKLPSVNDDNLRKVLSDTVTPAQMYNLSKMMEEGTITSASGTRVMELSLPVGTNAAIFYAKATRKSPQELSPNMDDNELFGCLEYTAGTSDGRTTDMTIIGSRAKARLNEENKVEYAFMEKLILETLNHLLRVGYNAKSGDDDYGGWNNTAHNETIGGYDLSTRKLSWYSYQSAVADTPTSPLGGTPSELEKRLGAAYRDMVNIKSLEIRAGSGMAIQRQIEDFYYLLMAAIYNGMVDDPKNNVALVMVNELVKNINYFFDADAVTNAIAWKTPTQVQSALSSRYGVVVSGSSTESLMEFPRHFHIPFGGATLVIDEELSKNKPYRQYAYNDTAINLGSVYSGDPTNRNFIIGVEDFTYTPELCYYCNTPLRTTDQNNLTVNSFPQSVSAWGQATNWSGWTEFGSVTSGTRGVALMNNVQYGVGVLESTVKCESTTFEDNNGGVNTGEQDKTITLGDNAKLTWTGILIGGQPDKVGWQYLAIKGTDNNPGTKFNKMIYDKVGYVDDDAEGYVVPINGEASTKNYTLVFDSYNPSLGKDEQSTVYVALEFRNDLGTDFWGSTNLVRSGGTFYLIGAMDPKAGSAIVPDTSTNTWWTNTRTHNNMMPPYDSEGKTLHAMRVFMQDFVTKADFRLNSSSLKKAIVTVPDLRSAKLSLGLSVDLDWQTGITYTVPLQ